MIDKLAGYKTQVRQLEKQLKELDPSKKADSTKMKEVTELIKNLKDIIREKEEKKEERRKKREEAEKAEPKPAEETPKAEAAAQPTEVIKESAPAPVEEVTKESTVEKLAVDDAVEPVRGKPGSRGTVIRAPGVNGDPLVYIKWNEGPIKEREEYGAYYESDLKKYSEPKPVDTNMIPRENLQQLEADLKSNYERMIKDLEEEHKTALDKGEAVWAARLEQKLADAKKAYAERFGGEKQADQVCYDCQANPRLDCPKCKGTGWIKKADENGSGGTEKLTVTDFTPAHDKDPQEKSIGYGGDRAYGWQTAPKGDESSLPLESAKKCVRCKEKDVLGKDSVFCKDCQKLSDEEEAWVQEQERKNASLNKDSKHTLKIKSLDDAQAECSEGDWHFTGTGPRTKEHIEEQFKKHVHASLNKQAINITIAEKLFVVNPLGKTAEEEYGFDVSLANGNKLFKITAKEDLNQEHLTKIIETELGNKKQAAVYPPCPCGHAETSHKWIPKGTGESFQCSECATGEACLLPEEFQKKGASRCAVCGIEFPSYPEYQKHREEAHGRKEYTPMDPAKKQDIVERFEKEHPKGIIGKLTSNLAFLKKGALVNILTVDKAKKQIKFAALDNSLRGWAPQSKFSAYNIPEAKLVPHENHQDEILGESGNELLVSCPVNSTNVIWRTIEAPPATPESLTLEEAKKKDKIDYSDPKVDWHKVHENIRREIRQLEKEEEGKKESSKECPYCGSSHYIPEENWCPICIRHPEKKEAKVEVKSDSIETAPGGLGNKKPDSDFDAEQLEKGRKVEMEHTTDPEVAKDIAKDHLVEDKDYYKKLELIHPHKDEEVKEAAGFGSVEWQDMMVNRVMEKHKKGIPLDESEQAFAETQAEHIKRMIDEQAKTSEIEDKTAAMPPMPTDPVLADEEYVFDPKTTKWFKQKKTTGY
jgi:hypothetical protein